MDANSRFDLVGTSPQFRKTVAQIQRMASIDATVLIAGETGTGKEVAARAMHYGSERAHKPFVPVNCAHWPNRWWKANCSATSAVPSPTPRPHRSAWSARPRAVRSSSTKSMRLTAKAQAALLRFLQDRTYRRVGGGALLQVDVRVLVASNADLDALARERRFPPGPAVSPARALAAPAAPARTPRRRRTARAQPAEAPEPPVPDPCPRAACGGRGFHPPL